MGRLTLDKFSARKVGTQLQKDANKVLKVKYDLLKKSIPSSGVVVLWDPPQDVVDGLKALLIKEQGFARDRQKKAIPFLEINKTIERLDKFQPEINT